MANTIALAEKFLPVLDEIYMRESLTSALDTPAHLVDFVGADTAKYYKLEMEGLGDYDRANGYPTGDVNGSWEAVKLDYSRGKELSVDRFDNEESLDLAFGKLVGEFMRTKVIPEKDAYVFSKIYDSVPSTSIVNANFTSSTNYLKLIDDAEAALLDRDVPMEGRILYVSPKMYAGIKGSVVRTLANETKVNRAVGMLDNMPVVIVPQNRFQSEVTFGTNGYSIKSGAYGINFMIVHPSAILNITKHAKPKIFSPEENQKKDAWMMQYRIYGTADVFDNKGDGVYIHRTSTANPAT